jgi:hypothetical protein
MIHRQVKKSRNTKKKKKNNEKRGLERSARKLVLMKGYKYWVEANFASKIIEMETTRKRLVPYSPPPRPARSLEDNESGEDSFVAHDASGDEEVNVAQVPASDQALPLGLDADAM